MFAVGMLPQRMAQLKFTRPYLQSDIYAVTTRSNRAVRSWADIDQPGVQVAVQAGTFMEPVMAAALKQARLVSIRPPATRERELEAGRVDVFMTDYPYSRRLLDNADWAMLMSPPTPFHVLPYAYAVKPGDDEWLAAVDQFVARIQRDGRLLTAAARATGWRRSSSADADADRATATPGCPPASGARRALGPTRAPSPEPARAPSPEPPRAPRAPACLDAGRIGGTASGLLLALGIVLLVVGQSGVRAPGRAGRGAGTQPSCWRACSRNTPRAASTPCRWRWRPGRHHRCRRTAPACRTSARR
jgi:hypothetical protein